jgi:hypothetical protein
LRRNAVPAAVPGAVAAAEDQGGEACLAAEVGSDLLVERYAIAVIVWANTVRMDAGPQSDLGEVTRGVSGTEPIPPARRKEGRK